MHRISAKSVIRVVLTSIFTLAAILMQCSVFPHLRLFGAIPEITVCVLVCTACYENVRFSCILAVAAGFVLDTLGGDGVTVSPVIFLLAVLFTVFLSRRLLGKTFAACALSALAALFAGAVKSVVMLLYKGASPFRTIVLKTALPQLLYGGIVFIIVFFIAKLYYRLLSVSDDE